MKSYEDAKAAYNNHLFFRRTYKRDHGEAAYKTELARLAAEVAKAATREAMEG